MPLNRYPKTEIEEIEVPTGMLELSERRTAWLFTHYIISTRKMKEILAMAYMQGFSDCVTFQELPKP